MQRGHFLDDSYQRAWHHLPEDARNLPFLAGAHPQSWNLGISPVHVPKTFGHKMIGKSVNASSEVFCFSTALFSIVICVIFQVLQDFSLLFGAETAARLLEKWPSYKPKLIKEAAALVQTPLLQRLLQSARGEQVESSAAYHPGKCSLV